MRHVLSATATLYHADCRDALRLLPSDSVDSVVTDPPYEIGFMGKAWDNRGIANDPVLWAEVLRVLKPGGHVAAFGASRGYHRMACAIEDAGFEIRDSLMWCYGTGFPKSQDVSKFIDKELGAQREVVGERDVGPDMRGGNYENAEGRMIATVTAPATDAAREWEGWGTALKPAFEPIVLARKPLSEGTVAANVLRWRTGAINIGACRVEAPGETITNHARSGDAEVLFGASKAQDTYQSAGQAAGRWPANVVHDGSDEVVGAFPHTGAGTGGQHSGTDPGMWAGKKRTTIHRHNDAAGSAARFFYSAKASKQDRNGSKHPTVKPISLMEWLATLITPPGGTVLDPFAGSGTTGKAAQNKGFSVILCEREAEYIADIQSRFDAPAQPTIRSPNPAELERLRRWNVLALDLRRRVANREAVC